ncbi:MAG: class I SAM-dependent methyltransferase [Erysipelotrichaceae bacterium]|nr:class I SAM-dependent methyltransferase [Erysipelotrichaceae bacterium]
MNDNKSFWEKVAFIYTKFMHKNNSTYDDICSIINQYLDESMNVLELACGTGQLSKSLYNKVDNYVATDFSLKMIQHAKKDHPQITFSVADATNLHYKDQTFDVVIISNALHIMPYPDVALKEISRVLKPNGLIIAPTFVYEANYNKLQIWFLEKAGFHTFHKWSRMEYIQYISSFGFNEIESQLLKGSPLDECIYIGRKDTI